MALPLRPFEDSSDEVIKSGLMPVSEIERQIIQAVIHRFLVDKEPTQRVWVAREFRNVDAIQRLTNIGVLKTNNGDDFFPTALAFHYSGDPQYEQSAKESVKIVASVLQDLFLTEPGQTDFTLANIEARAAKMHQNGEPQTIRLGLYLSGEFGWLAGWGGDINKYQITNLRISEHVVTLKDFEKLWDEQIERRTPTELRQRQGTKKSVPTPTKPTRSDWEEIKKLGGGGQSDVFLVRSPKRVAERLELLEKVQQSAGGSLIDADGAVELSESVFNFARPEHPLELGALKVFIPRAEGPDAEEQMMARLRNEIAVLSQNRPGLVRMLDSNVDERWIVTEYYPNGTLEAHPLLCRGDARSALIAFRSLVSTVANLHKDGIVHRDIKPANVFIGSDGQLVLGDFGIVFTPSNQDRATSTNERVGPRDFMPPWAEAGRLQDVDPNFDVYMLGKLLWCMVTGKSRLVREYYDRAENNLTSIFRHDPNMHAINQILDHCVVEDPASCCSSAVELLLIVNTHLTIIETGGQLLNDGVPRPCHVCGLGEYKPERSNTWSIRLWPASATVPTDTTLLAVRPFTCSNCGHVQFFKPRSA
ncbi:MAG TPA: protein kinase [Terriglobales bacterium]|nr:protein kinase [Terriglobales bacterium]